MPADHIQQLIELFDAVSEQPPAQRAALLEAACQGDVELRAEVERLMQAHEHADGFLEQPPLLAADSFDQSARVIGRRIGPYRLLREIGHGGMGAVYLAVRDDDAFQKQVAIKLVWPGWNRAEMLRRFLQERRILARLEHPHIARLLDGGTTEEGWPYVVMEYVDGVPITDYCAGQRLTISDRLRLLCQICQAVEYAHQHKVIHRDLKPGNLLVTEDGTVKLLDFGIARLLDPDDAPGSETQTLTGLRALTPEYASPEQIRGERMTASSDVYSLGVLLYELLTGERPYQISGHPLHEVIRIVCETEPTRPSGIRNSEFGIRKADGSKAEVKQSVKPQLPAAKSRIPNSEFRIPNSALRGDLDNIALMALRKNPAQRYASVAELRADIERHLKGEAVLARGDSLIYRAGRFVRRHRVAAVFCALLVFVLLSVILTLVWRNREARAAAQRNRPFVYAAQMRQAGQQWDEKDFAGLQRTLNEWRAQPGDEDLRGFEWYWLWRAANRAAATFPQPEWIDYVRFTPDGQSLMTLQGKNGLLYSARVIDPHSGQITRTVTAGADNAVLIYGRYLVTWRAIDDRIGHWRAGLLDLRTGNQLCDLTLGPHPDPDNIRPLLPSIDGRLLAVGTTSRQITIFEVATSQPLATISDDDRIIKIAISPSGHQLLTFHAGKPSTSWDISTGRRIKTTIDVNLFSNNYARLSPDQRRLWLHYRTPDNGALISYPDGQIINSKMSHREFIHSATFSPDSRRLATVSPDRTAKLWDAATGRELRTLSGHSDWCYEAAFSPDSRLLATASSDRTIRLWEVATGRELAILKGHPGEVHSVAFSPDGKLLASGGDDRLLKIWDVQQCLEPERLSEPENKIFSVALSPDSSQVAAACQHGELKLWHTQTGAVKILRAHQGMAFATAFSPDGRIVASGGEDYYLRLWDAASGNLIRTFDVHESPVRAVTFSPDGKMLASGGDLFVKLWNPETGALLARLPVRFGIRAIAFSPDGKMLATGGENGSGEIQLWDVATSRQTGALVGHTDAIWSVRFSPDGSLIATAGQDHTIRLWDSRTLDEVRKLSGHTDEVFSIAFSPDGRRLASGSNDQTVRLWDVQTGAELLRLKDHTEQVWAVAFSADGSTLVSGSWDGTARLYRAATEAEVSRRQGH